jgi:L-iditol 2-dehydrogenase
MVSGSTTMRGAVFHGPGDLRVEDVPHPGAPGPGEVLLRMRATAACGTDAKIMGHGHPRLEAPMVIGHELAGEVIAIGEGVTSRASLAGLAIGDGVQVIAAVPCGECWYCSHDRMTVCPNQTSMGYQYPGGFATHMMVPAAVTRVDGLNPIPAGTSFAEAAVTEPLACALNAQDLVRVGEGDDVLVMGAGPIGCLHVRLARAAGASTVVLADVNARRLARSAGLVDPDASIAIGDAQGDERLRQVVKELTDGRGPSVIITAAPAAAAQELAIELAAPQARISFFGGLPKDAPFIRCDSNIVHYRELMLMGANGSSPEHNRRALAMISSGRVPVLDLITHRFALEDVVAAIEEIGRGEAIKVVVEP